MYQNHSETSKRAWDDYDSAPLKDRIKNVLSNLRDYGATIDELSFLTGKVQGTISARMRELEDEKMVVKTNMRRETRSGREALVYVLPRYFKERMGRATIKGKSALDFLKEENSRLKKILKENNIEF